MRLAGLAVALFAATQGAALDQALPGYEFRFPSDHFEHRSFGAEWWYYTGNLSDADGREFGFEVTFFRAGLDAAPGSTTVWGLDQLYVAHFAITDIDAGRLHFRERLNRAGPGLAGASERAGAIWNGNWSATFLSGTPTKPVQRLWAGDAHASLELRLEAAKPVVIHGRDGVSQKAGGAGQASHYASFTRMRATGELVLGSDTFEVGGLAWMDHEFFTEGLADDLEGWDWLSVQLDDGTDLMLYGLRRKSGGHSQFSGGTLVQPDGSSFALRAEDIDLRPGREWVSQATGASYPVEWRVQIRSLGIELDVLARHDAQELVSESGRTPVYWEGPVRYTGHRSGRPVRGAGYLEMTGYDRPVEMGAE